MRKRHVTLLLAVALVVLAACSPQTVRTPTATPETSYRQLTVNGAPHYTLAPGAKAVQPILQKRRPPVYPPTLVHPGAAPVTVVAQLVVDKRGAVTGVYPVPDPDPGHAQFEAAVEHAAMQWTFTPLWMQQPKPDGTYLLTTKPFSLWFEFRFEVVNGKPQVSAEKQ